MSSGQHPGGIRLSVIVVVYGEEALLAECLRSLDVSLEAVEGETEVIVVLNRISPDGRQALVADGRSRLLVDTPSNLGFAGGVTVGLAHARGEWIALVNDDAAVDPPALAELIAAGSTSLEIGSVAPKIVFANQPAIVNSAGIEIDELGIAYERMLGEPASATGTEVVEVFGASGAAALYRRAMLDELGGFDESFFAYLEDADLAWRARVAGWRAVFAPSAVVRHHHSATFGHGSKSKHFLVGRNRMRMLARNATSAHLCRKGLAMVLYDLSYVAYVAARAGTLAPLRGRVSGLREWRRYRDAGARHRGDVRFAPSPGVLGALKRNRAYAER